MNFGDLGVSFNTWDVPYRTLLSITRAKCGESAQPATIAQGSVVSEAL